VSTPSDHDPYLALRFGDYRLLLTGSLISSLGGQMLALAIGWELYERTSSALALGIIGGVQILPVLALALIAGHVADRYHRKTVVMVSQLVLAATSLGLAAMSYWQGPLVAIYGILLLRGIGAAFSGPAANALPAEVLPEHVFENASSWRSTFGQVAAIAGPALAGLIIAAVRTATFVFVLAALASVVYVALLAFVRGRTPDHPTAIQRERPTLRSLGEGVVFLRRTPVILAAITLDLFAVLFGGATALMPIFAKDILQVGPSGLGWLQAAPSIGAAAVALYLAHRPPMQRAGRTLLLVVAGFGLATIFFGLSRSFALSLAMLATLGGLDAVSMVVRDTLVLARTPHDMRGRVAAIEGVFVSSSNQLGGFESGVTAQLFGPVVSVVGGGIGTILVVVLTALLSPELRGLRTLRASEPGAGIVAATSSPARQ
jgi:MFS family permease